MTTTAMSIAGAGRSGRGRGFRLGVAAGVVAPVALLAILSFIGGNDSSPGGAPAAQTAGLTEAELSAQRDALASFEEALEPLTERGAATVVYGMRPGINDIYDGRFDDETLATMAAGWVDAMEAIRRDVTAVESPAFLSETTDLYRQAFDAYHATARALHAATQTGGDQREEHISTAAEHGSRADILYDTAQAQLRQHRERLGIE